jgi:hypothetical protein
MVVMASGIPALHQSELLLFSSLPPCQLKRFNRIEGIQKVAATGLAESRDCFLMRRVRSSVFAFPSADTTSAGA